MANDMIILALISFVIAISSAMTQAYISGWESREELNNNINCGESEEDNQSEDSDILCKIDMVGVQKILTILLPIVTFLTFLSVIL